MRGEQFELAKSHRVTTADYPGVGYSSGLCTINADVVNADVLAFVQS